MVRTQLYLEDSMHESLRLLSRSRGETISELVRRALNEKYLPAERDRASIMAGFVGALSGRRIEDVDRHVRELRKGTRARRLAP